MTDIEREIRLTQSMLSGGHRPVQMAAEPGAQIFCCVCRLEENIKKKADKWVKGTKCSRNKSMMAACSCNDCTLHAHVLPPKEDFGYIWNIKEFRGLSCFQIAHHEKCRGLWRCYPEHLGTRHPLYTPRPSHSIYQILRNKYGLGPIRRKHTTSKTGPMTMMDQVVILKIGGSSITQKAHEETLNNDNLDWFAKLIATSVDESFLASSAPPRGRDADGHTTNDNNSTSNENGNNARKSKPKFIIVHGAGSFGHHSAKRYGLRCGKAAYLTDLAEDSNANTENNNAKEEHTQNNSQRPSKRCKQDTPPKSLSTQEKRYQMEALSKTRHSVQKLNAAVIHHLVKHGVNAVGISPGMSIPSLRAHGATTLPNKENDNKSKIRDNSVDGMRSLCKSISQSLQAGLIPVVHGDACLLYDGMHAGILGGDTIAEGLATLWEEGTEPSTKNDDGNGDASTEQQKCNNKNKILQVIFITDVGGVYTSDPKSDKDAQLIRSLKIDKMSGEVSVDNVNDGGDESGDGSERTGASLQVSGSSHAHDVTGGLKAKLGAAVTIVQSGIDVIIAQCGSVSAEKFVKGEYTSVYDVEEGTLLTQSES